MKKILSIVISTLLLLSTISVYNIVKSTSKNIPDSEYIDYKEILINETNRLSKEDKLKKLILELENIDDVKLNYDDNNYTVELSLINNHLEITDEIFHYIEQLILNNIDDIKEEQIDIKTNKIQKKIMIKKIEPHLYVDNYSWWIRTEMNELSNAMQKLGFDNFNMASDPNDYLKGIFPEIVLREDNFDLYYVCNQFELDYDKTLNLLNAGEVIEIYY